jgi:predicted GNAT family N-acyltransferase
MDAKSRRRWFGRFITRYRSAGEIAAAPRTPAFEAALKSLAAGGLLLRHPFAAQRLVEAGKDALLFVDGEAWQMDQRSAHVLASYEAIDDAALAKLGDAGRDALASLLRRATTSCRNRRGAADESLSDAGFRVEPADYTVDFKDLRAVREPVFVQEQNVPLELEWDEMDPQCRHVIARDDAHRPIGTGRLTPEHKIGRMAVLQEWRAAASVEALLLALIEQAREQGLPEVSLHAQADADRLLRKVRLRALRRALRGRRHPAPVHAPGAAPLAHERRAGPRPRGPSQPAVDFEGLEAAREALLALVHGARATSWSTPATWSRRCIAHPPIVQAFKEFAISGRGGVAASWCRTRCWRSAARTRCCAVAPAAVHRLPGAHAAGRRGAAVPLGVRRHRRRRLPVPPAGQPLRGRLEPGPAGPQPPAAEHFQRVWERARPCTELRSLQI